MGPVFGRRDLGGWDALACFDLFVFVQCNPELLLLAFVTDNDSDYFL